MGTSLNLKSNFATANRDYRTLANNIFDQDLPGNYQMYTEIVPASAQSMRYDWISASPVMRLWLGAKIEKTLRAWNRSLTALPYEATMSIKRPDMQYDTSGAIGKKFNNFLSNTAYVYDKFCFEQLVSNTGAGPTCYDGQALISASHPTYLASDVTATDSNHSTNQLTEANVESAMIAMNEITSDNDEPLNISPTTMIVGPYKFKDAKEILDADNRLITVDTQGAEATTYVVAATNKSNVWQGSMKLVVDNRLTGSANKYYWYLLDESKAGIKPIVLMELEKPHGVTQTDPDNERRFWFDEYVYSVEGLFVADAGEWRVINGNLATA